MSVLILKNVPNEGPGTIEDFLRDNGMDYRVVEMTSQELQSPAGADTLVIMGGPMSVNESDLYPYIETELRLAGDFMRRGKRVLGICLGAQIMAKALGAKVYPGPEKEIGWYDIELQDHDMLDQTFRRLAVHPADGDFEKKFKVFHWHGETFDIPAGAERLASSALYQNQAFRYGDNAYAFQFHIEVRKEMIFEWLRGEPVDMNKIRTETDAFYGDYLGRAMNFYNVFFRTGSSAVK